MQGLTQTPVAGRLHLQGKPVDAGKGFVRSEILHHLTYWQNFPEHDILRVPGIVVLHGPDPGRIEI
jgi:hypothetical protein